MVISLEEAKLYLRLDSNEDDALVTQLIEAAESLCMDIARMRCAVRAGRVDETIRVLRPR